MPMSKLLWLSHTEPGHCVLGATRIRNVGKLHVGEAVPSDFGQPIQYKMSDLFPDDLELSDNYVVAGNIVISRQLRDALEPLLAGHRLQYLPVSILNHKKRVASTDYFILHSQDVFDCIDVAKSKVKWNPLDKNEVLFCERLVINPGSVPSNTLIFRPKYWGSRILAADSLAKTLSAGGFVGLRFLDPAQYTGVE
jgi:hypothetical protein